MCARSDIIAIYKGSLKEAVVIAVVKAVALVVKAV